MILREAFVSKQINLLRFDQGDGDEKMISKQLLEYTYKALGESTTHTIRYHTASMAIKLGEMRRRAGIQMVNWISSHPFSLVYYHSGKILGADVTHHSRRQE